MKKLLFIFQLKKKVQVSKIKQRILIISLLTAVFFGLFIFANSVDAILGPKEGRISTEEVKKIAKEIGLKLEKEFPAGRAHYGLLFIKE